MFDNELRDDFESIGYYYVSTLLNNLQDEGYITVTDITKSTDEFSPYDVTANINGKQYYIECKTRTDSYSYTDFIDDGYYLNSKKIDGQNNLYAIIWEKDKIVMLTNTDQIKDLKPEQTKVRHIKYCDKDSPDGFVSNLKIKYERFWTFQIDPFKRISTPNNVVRI